MLVFRGRPYTVQKKKLGPIQPNAQRPTLQAGGNLVGELDITPEPHMGSVQGLGGLVGEPGQSLKPRRALGGGMAVAFERGRVRVKDDQSLVAVDDDHPRASDMVREPAQPDDGRDLQRLGHDGGMAGEPPASVAATRTCRGSSPAVSLGERSCARMTLGSASASATEGGRWPESCARIRCSMSRTSAARAER